MTTKNLQDIKFGYQVDCWQGAKWAATNAVWVKRPVYIVEAKSKDPYYNLGFQYIWIDAETGMAMLKVQHDRSGEYWKTTVLGGCGFTTEDKKTRFELYALQLIVNDRENRATNVNAMTSQNNWNFWADLNLNVFSQGGFSKLCK